MDGTLEIKTASLLELDELAMLFARYREFYNGCLELDASKDFIAQRLIKEESIVFVARLNSEQTSVLVGFTQLYPSFSSVSAKSSLILNDLFVLEEYRRLGVAKRLMDAAYDYASSVNANGLSLCTQSENVYAQNLYESIGYKKDESFFHYFLPVTVAGG